MSCPGCRNIKLLDVQTGSSITAFRSNQYKPDLMCHGDTGCIYVFSLKDPYPVIELKCHLDPLFTERPQTLDCGLRHESLDTVLNGPSLDPGLKQLSTNALCSVSNGPSPHKILDPELRHVPVDALDCVPNGPSEIVDSGLRQSEILDSGLRQALTDSVFTGPSRTLDSGLRQWCTGMCYLPAPHHSIVLSIASEAIIRAISVDRNEISWEVTGEVDGLRCNPWGLMYSARHGALLVCDGDNRRIVVLEPSDGSHRQTLPVPGSTGSTYDIASHDDRIVLLHQTKISYLAIS